MSLLALAPLSVARASVVLLYLDPGSGSVILQVIIASLLAIGIIARTQWARLKKLFGRRSHSSEDEEQEQKGD